LGGTIVCGVTDTEAGRAAAQLADALRIRLGLRLVVVHVTGRASGSQTGGEGAAGARLARDLGLDGDVEARVAPGDPAELLARIAAEEAADLIVVGSRAAGLHGRSLRSDVVRELEAATPVPVLVAPPQTRRRSGRRLAAVEATRAR
jgi:nucleotide-binding universal stress UspA family protein